MQLFERGLAYQEELPVCWCPELGTVLANEEVIDGKSEVGGFPSCAGRCASGCSRSPSTPTGCSRISTRSTGPSSTKEMQRELDRPQRGRRDRLFARRRPPRARARACSRRGPTRCSARPTWSLAPEHPLVDRLTTDGQRARVAAYKEQASRKSELERTELQKDKTGVFTGAYAINPVNERQDPDLDRRLRARGLRHGRDHGRARRKTSATTSSRRRTGCRSSAP